MKFVGEKFRYSKHLQKHVEDNYKNVGTVEYFRRYLLKEPDEKFGKCLICGESLEVKRRNFSFIWKTGFSKHWHQKCSTATKEHWILMFGKEEGLKKWNHYCELQSKTNTFEYNGEKFHAKSPDDKDFCNPYCPDLTAAEQWRFDENKKLCAERNGYKIFYIWNNDYLTDKDGIVEKCVNIIKENCNL